MQAEERKNFFLALVVGILTPINMALIVAALLGVASSKDSGDFLIAAFSTAKYASGGIILGLGAFVTILCLGKSFIRILFLVLGLAASGSLIFVFPPYPLTWNNAIQTFLFAGIGMSVTGALVGCFTYVEVTLIVLVIRYKAHQARQNAVRRSQRQSEPAYVEPTKQD